MKKPGDVTIAETVYSTNNLGGEIQSELGEKIPVTPPPPEWSDSFQEMMRNKDSMTDEEMKECLRTLGLWFQY